METTQNGVAAGCIQKALPARVLIDGEYWPTKWTTENVRSAKVMRPREDDIFICTYPKSGTTWIQHIVHQLLGRTDYEEIVSCESSTAAQNGQKSMWAISPQIERMGDEYLETVKAPRVLKSHFTYQNMPKRGGAKYIYCCRNPKDTLNSFFHHHRVMKAYDFENGDFDAFFDLFMNGQVAYGDYFDHLSSWLAGIEKGEEKILLLKYEDMVADLRTSIVQIANLLGGNVMTTIENNEKLAQIVVSSSFGSMQKNQERWGPTVHLHDREAFIRKGGTRDWKSLFSLDQSNRMDTLFRERCAVTVAADWWQPEMGWNEV